MAKTKAYEPTMDWLDVVAKETEHGLAYVRERSPNWFTCVAKYVVWKNVRPPVAFSIIRRSKGWWFPLAWITSPADSWSEPTVHQENNEGRLL